MFSDSSWFSISVFLPKSHWHIFLKNCIEPLISRTTRDDLLIHFALQFSKYRGENIQVLLLAKNSDAALITKTTDKHINFFLAKNALCPTRKPAPYDSIFMPFPENTIQYGITNMDNIPTGNQINCLQLNSMTMILGLGNESIDDNLVFTFAVYVLLTAYNVLPTSSKIVVVKENLDCYKDKLTQFADQQSISEERGDKYNSLILLVGEIYNDTISSSEINLPWLQRFGDKFSKVIQDMNDESKMRQVFLGFEKQLAWQLNLDLFDLVLLYELIYDIFMEAQRTQINALNTLRSN